MTTRTVLVKLKADIADFNRSLGQASAKAKQAGADLEKFSLKNKQDMAQVGQAGLAMGVAIAAGVGAAVKTFADFDAAMSGVEAATHASAAAMDQLRAAALDAGARTVFSATEAADAIEQLAKAGVSTADILGGGLDGALDLAAAGGLEVGAAAEIAATALTQFGLAGSQIPHVADLLAAAAGKAQGDVSDMGMALKQAGLVASQTGLSIEETTAGLASFASAGLLGSDAGTSFKSMLQRLTPQSAEAAGEMERLGISAYDAQGNFIGLEAFAGNLQDSLAGLTVEQRNSAMATIFGSDAVRAASVLYSEGAAGIAKWTENVNDAGFAQETAAIKLDNLKGDWEAFMGSLETAFIKTGAAGDGFARGSVQQATEVINAYSGLPPAAQSAVLAVGGITGAAALAAGGFLLLAPRIVETRVAMAALATQMPATTAAMAALGKTLGVLALAAGAFVAVDQIVDVMADAPPSVNAFTDALADFAQRGQMTGEVARVLGQDFSGLAEQLDQASQAKWFSLDFGTTNSDIQEAREVVEGLDQALAGLVQSGHADVAAESLRAMAEQTGLSESELRNRLGAYEEALAGVSAEAKLAAGAQGEMAGAVESATGAVVDQGEALSDLMDKVRALSEQVLGLRGSSRGYESALDDATKALAENGKTLDITTAKGRENEAALDGIAAAAADVLESMVASGKPISDVTAKFDQQREALINAAIGFGMTREGAEAYTDSVLRIPDKKTTAVVLTGADAATAQVERLRQYLASLTNKTVTVRVDQVLGTTVQRGGVAGRVVERAAGGPVFGPGTGTSDSIPAWLSNGEHVWTAAEVLAAGGHDAVERIRRSVRGFATGGAVRLASGGPVSGSDPRSLTTAVNAAAARGAGVEEIRALVRAWEDYNEQLEQAARRQQLVDARSQASANTKVKASVEDMARAQEEFNEATKALADFDFAAARDAEAAAVERLTAAMEKQTEANQRAYAERRTRQDNKYELGLISPQTYLDILNRRLADEQRFSDEWMAIYRQREQVMQDQADAAADLTDALADELERRERDQNSALDLLNDLLDREQQIRGRQVQAEAEYYTRRSALGREFNAEQQRILDARRTGLANWARLDQVSSPAWGNTVEQLLANATDQLAQFQEWTDELAAARSRGLSEDVITALGLDEGPQALGQLRQFSRATQQEIDELNAQVARRTAAAGEQVAREQRGAYGALGRELLAAQQQFTAELAALEAEFLAEQQELAAELAQLGEDTGRTYAEAIAAGIDSGIPAIRAATAAAIAAMADLAAAQAAVAAPPTSGTQPVTALPGGTDSPFRRPGSRLNPYIRDSGGPLLPGWTYNGTGQAERVVGPQQSIGAGGVTYVLQFNAPVYGMDDFRGQVTGVLDSALGERKSAARGHGSRT